MISFPVSRKQKKDFDEVMRLLSSTEEQIMIQTDIFLDKKDILENMEERGAISISQYIGDDVKRIEVVDLKSFYNWFVSENKHAKKLTTKEKKNIVLNSLLSFVVSLLTTLITLKINGAI